MDIDISWQTLEYYAGIAGTLAGGNTLCGDMYKQNDFDQLPSDAIVVLKHIHCIVIGLTIFFSLNDVCFTFLCFMLMGIVTGF